MSEARAGEQSFYVRVLLPKHVERAVVVLRSAERVPFRAARDRFKELDESRDRAAVDRVAVRLLE